MIPSDRPREKLLVRGPESLGVNELLAVVLGSGTRGVSALELSNRLLSHAGGLEGLARLGASGLSELSGLKAARSARILAALELGKRTTWPDETARPRFRLPHDAAHFLVPRFGTKPLEEFGLLLLDTRNRLKRLEVVSKGSLNGSLVHPREVYREAAIRQAAAIIAFHNHPSGDPSPSRDDRALTKRLVKAGAILGIELLDHVIVSASRYWSFKEHNEL